MPFKDELIIITNQKEESIGDQQGKLMTEKKLIFLLEVTYTCMLHSLLTCFLIDNILEFCCRLFLASVYSTWPRQALQGRQHITKVGKYIAFSCSVIGSF